MRIHLPTYFTTRPISIDSDSGATLFLRRIHKQLIQRTRFAPLKDSLREYLYRISTCVMCVHQYFFRKITAHFRERRCAASV
ncbi:MAG TPA: hypothetical protein VFE62_13155 [Gemmataceae bacterium]|nr:hypothetical protein [Gemmataceae bacterium]